MLEIFGEPILCKNSTRNASHNTLDPSYSTCVTETFKRSTSGTLPSHSKEFSMGLYTPVSDRPKATPGLSVTFSEKTIKISPRQWHSNSKKSHDKSSTNTSKRCNKKGYCRVDEFSFDDRRLCDNDSQNKAFAKETFKWNENTTSNKDTKKNAFVAEDFQLTPLQKYQNSSPEKIYRSKSENNYISQLTGYSFQSYKDIRRRVFSSSDFIDTPLKKRKFTLSPPVSYPMTSTPLVPLNSTVSSPDILNKSQVTEIFGQKQLTKGNFGIDGTITYPLQTLKYVYHY